MNRIKVLMVGPARNVKGGMTTVVDNYYKCGLDKMVYLKYIESINDKNKISKIIKEIKGIREFKKCIDYFDVVHIHMASRRSTFRKCKYIKIAKNHNKKIIVHVHGAEYKLFYKECSERKKKYVKRMLNIADKIIVLSEEWKNFFSTIIDINKIVVIYNSMVIPEDFSKNIDTKKILFLGRLGKRKGIYDLINVIEKLTKKYQDIELLIGGDGEVEKVQSIIESKKLNKNIKYLGWVSGRKKEELLKECSYYVLPSYNEGMPMSVIEGMAYKNITISTNVGGIPKIITNETNGMIITPGDIEKLYNDFSKLFTDKKLRKKISENGRKTIEEKFNIAKVIEKLIELYK